MRIFKRIYRFIRYNTEKKLSLLCWYYSAKYRIQMLYTKPNKLPRKWGIEGEESPEKDTPENYAYAGRISWCVNQVCSKTSWESKCLVRALTAQTLLRKKGIKTTLYLGCRLDEGKMVAHAWLRCGEKYVTGGNGVKNGYAMVDKFLSK